MPLLILVTNSGPTGATEALRRSNEALQETNNLLDDGDPLAQNFFGGIASGAATAAQEMAELDAATGSLFNQARKMTELDPAEFFFEEALAAGASAEKLRTGVDRNWA